MGYWPVALEDYSDSSGMMILLERLNGSTRSNLLSKRRHRRGKHIDPNHID
jgi:hypothetical protein